MRLESIDKESHISIEYVDSELERYPSVCFSLCVNNEGFAGFNKDVWFELDLLKQFILNLREMDIMRKGFASFGSMSPDEFYLSIEQYDMSGHLMLNYKISKYTNQPKVDKLSLSGGFELDSSLFTKLVNDFTKLADESKYPPPKYPFINND